MIEFVFGRIHAHLDTRAHVSHPLVIVAPPGAGKSALVANYVKNYRHFLPQALWLQYYIGCSNESTNFQRIVCSMMQAMKDRYFCILAPWASSLVHHQPRVNPKFESIDLRPAIAGTSMPQMVDVSFASAIIGRFGLEEDVPKKLSPNEWQKEMLVWLGMAATRGRMVIFLDGMDQVDDSHEHALDLQWLPRSFPAECRTVITCSPGPALDAMLERGWPCVELEEIDIESRAEVVERYMSMNSYPAIDPVIKNEILQLPLAGNPNYLLQLIDEVAILTKTGRANSVADYVLYLKAENMEAFYDYVLWKWEKFFDSIHANFVRRVTSLIWASRWGLSEQEILMIFSDIPRVELLHFFNLTKYCWHFSDGMVNFSHNTLRTAVETRYIPTKLEKIGVHRQLGGYFRTLPLGRRRIDEEVLPCIKPPSFHPNSNNCSMLECFFFISGLMPMLILDPFCEMRRCELSHPHAIGARRPVCTSCVKFQPAAAPSRRCKLSRPHTIVSQGWHWMMGESWLELLTTINNFVYFPRLYDCDDGIYHCDLRRFYKQVGTKISNLKPWTRKPEIQRIRVFAHASCGRLPHR